MTTEIEATKAQLQQQLAQLELDEQRTAARLEALSDRRKGLSGVLEGIELALRLMAKIGKQEGDHGIDN